MEPENKNFRVELGLNLYAAPVPQTNPNMRILPLQNALVELDGKGRKKARPAWYTDLCIGDTISFRLVDITALRVPDHEPDYPNIALAEFYFNNPSTGRAANPFTEDILEWRFSEQRVDQTSPVFSRRKRHLLPTWDLFACTAKGQEVKTLTFNDFSPTEEEAHSFRAFELTVAIKMLREGGWVNHYVFDPEMIVSETDSEDDGGGRQDD